MLEYNLAALITTLLLADHSLIGMENSWIFKYFIERMERPIKIHRKLLRRLRSFLRPISKRIRTMRLLALPRLDHYVLIKALLNMDLLLRLLKSCGRIWICSIFLKTELKQIKSKLIQT